MIESKTILIFESKLVVKTQIHIFKNIKLFNYKRQELEMSNINCH